MTHGPVEQPKSFVSIEDLQQKDGFAITIDYHSFPFYYSAFISWLFYNYQMEGIPICIISTNSPKIKCSFQCEAFLII